MSSIGIPDPQGNDRLAFIQGMPNSMSPVEIVTAVFAPLGGPQEAWPYNDRHGYRIDTSPRRLIEFSGRYQSYQFGEEAFGRDDILSILQFNLQQDNPETFYIFPQAGIAGKALLFTKKPLESAWLMAYNRWKMNGKMNHLTHEN